MPLLSALTSILKLLSFVTDWIKERNTRKALEAAEARGAKEATEQAKSKAHERAEEAKNISQSIKDSAASDDISLEWLQPSKRNKGGDGK